MLKNLSKYLFKLRKNANYWERVNVNNEEDKSFGAKYLRKLIFGLIAVSFVYRLHDGFPHFFVDFSSKTLAIIVGLFMTAIIFSFNKFYDPIKKEDKDKVSSTQKLGNTQDFNYTKQFAYITGYNVVLCLFVLTALSLNTLFEHSMNANLTNYEFKFDKITFASGLLFIKLLFVALQRFLVLYWMLRILFSTLYTVSSMIEFMSIKLDKNSD